MSYQAVPLGRSKQVKAVLHMAILKKIGKKADKKVAARCL
jgi:hypothetical protein